MSTRAHTSCYSSTNLQPLFRQLTLEHFLLDRASGQKAVNVTTLSLAVAPDAACRLLVVRRVPVGVEKHEPVRANEIQAAPPRLAAQEKRKRIRAWVVKSVGAHRKMRPQGPKDGPIDEPPFRTPNTPNTTQNRKQKR